MQFKLARTQDVLLSTHAYTASTQPVAHTHPGPVARHEITQMTNMSCQARHPLLREQSAVPVCVGVGTAEEKQLGGVLAWGQKGETCHTKQGQALMHGRPGMAH
jgi:hypothetical protein